MGGGGGCKVALPGSLPLKGGGSKDLHPQNIVGGLCPDQKELFCVCVVIGALLELSLLSLYTAAYRGIISTGGVLVLHPGGADSGGGVLWGQ